LKILHVTILDTEISKAGAFSYLSSGGFLTICRNELTDERTKFDNGLRSRTDIPSYTTSDHGPVLARFELKEDVTLSTNDVIGKMS
jgi:hypothetical protein